MSVLDASKLALKAVWLLSASSAAFAAEVECDLRQVTDRIHVIVGSDHQTCPIKAVEHPLTNPGIVVGDAGVIVIDPGSSLQVGRLVMDRIEGLTDKPVVAVFNTHIHGLYWLGNQAVKERYPDAVIHAHERMIARIRSGEGAFWVEAITGGHEGDATDYVVPDVGLKGGEILSIAGIRLHIHHPGHAHTDHDLYVEVPDERAVFLGGLVVEPEVPSQGVPQDADFEGQISATRELLDLAVERYIPGRGEPAGKELPTRAVAFLEALYEGTNRYYEQDLADYEITERLKADLSDYERWYDFGQLGAVISEMYLQVEAASL